MLSVTPSEDHTSFGQVRPGANSCSQTEFFFDQQRLDTDHLGAAYLQEKLVRCGRERNFEMLQDMVNQKLCRNFDAVNAATALHRLSTIYSAYNQAHIPGIEQTIMIVLARGIETFHECTPRNLSNLIWSTTKILQQLTRKSDDGLTKKEKTSFISCLLKFIEWVSIGQETTVRSICRDMDSLSFSNLVWSFAQVMKLKLPHERGFRHVTRVTFFALQMHLPLFVDVLKARELSQIVWGLANSTARGAGRDNGLTNVFISLADRMLGILSVANCARELSTTIYAMSVAGIYHEALFGIAASYAMERVNGFTFTDLVNFLWGYGAQGVKVPDMFVFFAENRIIPELRSNQIIDCGQISLVLWSFAKTWVYHEDLYREASDFIIKRIQSYYSGNRSAKVSSYDISITCWCWANVGHDYPPYFEGVAKCMPSFISDMSQQDLANIVYAFVTVDRSDVDVFRLAASRVVDYQLFSTQNAPVVGKQWIFLINAMAPLKKHFEKEFSFIITEFQRLIFDPLITLWRRLVDIRSEFQHRVRVGRITLLEEVYENTFRDAFSYVQKSDKKILSKKSDNTCFSEIEIGSQIMKEIQRLGTKLRIDHLDESYTLRALRYLNILANPEDPVNTWLDQGRDEDISPWLHYRVETDSSVLDEPGTHVPPLETIEIPDPHLEEALKPLAPVVSQNHPERLAVVYFVQQLVLEKSQKGKGFLHIFFFTLPCISCVTLLCQFTRTFPKIQLRVGFAADITGKDEFLES